MMANITTVFRPSGSLQGFFLNGVTEKSNIMFSVIEYILDKKVDSKIHRYQ